MEEALEEMEIMIIIEEEQNRLKELNTYMYESEEQKYMVDNYMLDVKEQAGTQRSGEILDFD